MQIHTHTQRHTHTHKKKTSAASRGFVVSSVGCLSQMRDTTNCPVAFFFALCPFHRFFFCNVSVTLHFFLHFARSIPSFFNTLPVTSFFLHFVCHIAFFFAIWWLLRIFFCNPLSQLHFFEREDWRSQRCIFFARRICIIRLLQFRLHFSLHFCIYFVFFCVFFLNFFTL